MSNIIINPDIVKPITEAAKETLPKTVDNTDEALSTVVGFFDNVVLYPLKKANIEFKYKLENFEKDLREKTKDISAEDFQEPPVMISGPTLEALRYAYDEDELRNMYENLLASSMNKNNEAIIHPSYVEIIKQLSPDEAKLLKKISNNGNSYPVVDIRINGKGNGYINYIVNFTTLAEDVCEHYENVNSYIDNFMRLRIIDIPPMVKIHDDEAYQEIETCGFIKSLLDSPLPENNSWQIIRKKFELTEFGKRFIDVCIRCK